MFQIRDKNNFKFPKIFLNFGKVLRWPRHIFFQSLPIKARPWIFFPTWRNVLMTRNVCNGIVLAQGGAQPSQAFVLQRLEGLTLQAFKLDADGIVIAIVSAAVFGRACMPSSIVATHKLPHGAIAFNEKMRGNFQPPNALKVGVCVPIKLVAKQLLDFAATIDARGKADGMHHDQVDQGGFWPWAKIGRLAQLRALAPSVLPFVKATKEGRVAHRWAYVC